MDSSKLASRELLVHLKDSVDAGIAGHQDAVGRHVLAPEILRGAFSGREMQRAQTSGEDAIQFFREWLAHVAGAQTGFHVAYGNARIKRGQGTAKSGGGVALHQDDAGPFGGEHTLERRQNAAADYASVCPGCIRLRS